LAADIIKATTLTVVLLALGFTTVCATCPTFLAGLDHEITGICLGRIRAAIIVFGLRAVLRTLLGSTMTLRTTLGLALGNRRLVLVQNELHHPIQVASESWARIPSVRVADYIEASSFVGENSSEKTCYYAADY
jgi:hypothetical protein